MKEKSKKRILVIEDEEDITSYLTAVLEDNGYEVETAANGVEAMKKIREKKPDLISLDISLPEKTGVNIYCELKGDSELSAIPVVIVTGVTRQLKNIIISNKVLPPPEGFISKPFQVAELQRAISKALKESA